MISAAAPTIRIEARFKNARLYNAIAEKSVQVRDSPGAASLHAAAPVKAWCELHDIQKTYVYDLLNLRRGPYAKLPGGGLRIRAICERIAALLERDVAWLFPPEIYGVKWPTLAADIDHGRMIAIGRAPREALLLPPAQEAPILEAELKHRVDAALAKITPREALVLRRRFGFDDDDPKSLEEIAQELGVSRERVHQIEAKALRKMRHPVRSRALEGLLDDERG